MAFGLIYYNDIASSQRFEKTVRVEILERDYTGSSSQIKAQPLISIGKSGDGREEPIKKKNCTLKILSERSLQFEHLFTSDDRKYQVKVYYDSNLVFIGFLESDSYEEPYAFYENYEIELTARDNLGRLEDIDYLDGSGDRITGLQRITQILSFILGKTGASLLTNNYLEIYASGQDENIDPWGQVYINTSGFWNVTNNEPISCFEVLERILKGYGAQIRQVGEFWEIREQAGYYNAPNVDVDDILPRFMQDRLNFPVVPNQTYWLNQAARLSLQPAWKKFTLNQDYLSPDSALEVMPMSDNDFTFAGAINNPDGYNLDDWNQDVGFIVRHFPNKNDFEIRIDRVNYVIPGVIPGFVQANRDFNLKQTNNTVEFDLDILIDSTSSSGNADVAIDIINGSSILTSSGWVAYTTQERELEFTIPRNVKTSVKVIAEGIPNSGGITIKLWNSDSERFTSYSKFNVIISDSSRIVLKERTLIGAIDENNNLIPDNFKFSIGEVPENDNAEIIHLGGLFDSSGNALTGWHRKGDSTNKTLLQVVAEGYDLLNNKVSRQISGSLFWQWDMWTNIKDQGRTLMLNAGTWDLVNDRLDSAEFIEVFEYKNTLGAFDDGFDDGFDNSDLAEYNTNTIFTITEKTE